MATEGATTISELTDTGPASNAPAGEGDDELRQLKTTLLAGFPELDGLISNAGGTDPTAGGDDTDPPNAATFTRLFTDLRTLLTAGNGVPLRGIVMWAGTEADIPSGWALCDGGTANSVVTPDLRNRFILGADESNSVYPIGSAGGNTWDITGAFPVMDTGSGGQGTGTGSLNLPPHNITVDNLPQHQHHLIDVVGDSGEMGNNPVPPGSSTTMSWKGNQDNGSNDYAIQGVAGAAAACLSSQSGGVAGPIGLTHPATDLDISIDAHSHTYIPLFYALAYIMYVGVAP